MSVIKRCLALAAVCCGALLLVAGSATAQEFKFKLHTLIPPVAPPIKDFLKPWSDKIRKDSNGRIDITIYPSMQLGGAPPQLYNQVKDGVVDIVWTLPGYTAGRFVRTEVFELPFVATEPIATNLAIQDFIARHGEDYEEIHVILVHVHAGHAFHSHNPIRKVEDVQGLKIRTPSRTGGWLLEAMGAVPVGAPVPAIPEMLSKKVVDAVLIPFEIAVPLKTHEMVKYHTVLNDPHYPRPGTSTFLLAMNKNSYAKLPPDLKKVMDDNSGRHIAKMAGEVWTRVEGPGEKLARSTGEMISMAPAEVKRLREKVEGPVQQRWIEEVKGRGIDGAALLKEAKDLIEKYSR